MSSKSKFSAVILNAHGFDDIGTNQPTGGITGGVTNALVEGPLFSGKLSLTLIATAPTALKKGSPVRISGMDSFHSGLTRVLKVVRPYKLVVNLAYNGPSATTAPGAWALDGGSGAWDGFQVMGADILGATNVQLTFYDPNRQGGDEMKTDYQEGKVYVFPGTIRTVQINTSGNLRMIRAATLRPRGNWT